MSTIVGFFTTNTLENDIAVNEFIRKHFPRVKTKVYDLSFVTGQISKPLL